MKPKQNNLSLTKLPYFDISRQHQRLWDETREALEKVYASGAFVLGPEVKAFETAFANYIGTSHALGVGSGTDALIFALKALDIGKGDEVIVPSFTFSATVLAVLHLGAAPVFADVEESTFNLDSKSVEKALSKKTRAVIPVHLFGQSADMDALMAIAKKKKLAVVEDACQAHGAAWGNQKVGSFGDAGCFSFYPTKNLGGIGDGGMITTSKAQLVKRVLQYRNLGKGIEDPLVHDEIGWTSRLDSVQSAFLRIKLKSLDALNEERRMLAGKFHKALQNTPLGLPLESAKAYHVYHIYVVRVPNGKRDALKQYLAAEGIPSMIHYATPVHRQPIMQRFPTRSVPLPVTEKLHSQVLTLPFFPGMTEEEVEGVCGSVRKFFKKRS